MGRTVWMYMLPAHITMQLYTKSAYNNYKNIKQELYTCHSICMSHSLWSCTPTHKSRDIVWMSPVVDEQRQRCCGRLCIVWPAESRGWADVRPASNHPSNLTVSHQHLKFGDYNEKASAVPVFLYFYILIDIWHYIESLEVVDPILWIPRTQIMDPNHDLDLFTLLQFSISIIEHKTRGILQSRIKELASSLRR
jgi:hypothetical protein